MQEGLIITALETMEDGMIVLDNDWCYQFSNYSAQTLFPVLRNCVKAEDVTHKPDWPKQFKRRTNSVTVNFEQNDSGGVLQYYRASIRTVENPQGAQIGWSIVIRNVTEVTVMINQMEVLATTDPLTGIYNRRNFYARVCQEMDRARRHPVEMSLILFDIDHFKVVNDTYGHSVGDIVLCGVVEATKNQLRPYDIFARYGGEEFVIFTTSEDTLDLQQFSDRLRKAIEDMCIAYGGDEIKITASYGAVKVLPHDSIDNAFVAVDKALYQAKSQGRNRSIIGEIQAEERLL